MIHKIIERIKFIGITRDVRIRNYINNIESNVKLRSKLDKKLVKDINILIEDRIKSLNRIYIITTILYVGIYFSFFSLFFSNFLILNDLGKLISQIVGFFGTTTLVIILFFVNRIKELYYQDLNLFAMHLISIYNGNLEKGEELFNVNNYSSFINFFKKRGF